MAIVLDPGQSLPIHTSGRDVWILGLPGSPQADVECYSRDAGWTSAPDNGAGFRMCARSTFVSLRVQPDSGLTPTAAVCVDCADPGENHPLVLRSSVDAMKRAADPSLLAQGMSLGLSVDGDYVPGSSNHAGWTAPQVDIGWRFSDTFYAGAYVGIGEQPNSSADSTGQAAEWPDTRRMTRAGITARLTWLPLRISRKWSFLPYLGGSIGGATTRANLPSASYPGAANVGPDARVELGFPFGFERTLTVGPYLGVSATWLNTELYGVQSFETSDVLLGGLVLGVNGSWILPFRGDW
jgi:hypothetical protein